MEKFRLFLSYSKTRRLMTRLSLFFGVVLVVITCKQSLAPAMPSLDITHFDKIIHFLVYGCLAGVWVTALPKTHKFLIIGALSLMGVGLEFGQFIMSLGRTASFADSLANVLGALCGGTVAAYIQAWVNKPAQKLARQA